LVIARGEGKRREIRIVGENATTSSDVGSRGSGSGRVAINLMEKILIFLYHNTNYYYYSGYIPLLH
jgi:hypothetical protein